MSEQGKNFWQRTWNEPRHFFLWLTFLSLAGMVMLMIFISILPSTRPRGWLQTGTVIVLAGLGLALVLGVAGFVLSLIPPIRVWLEDILHRRFFVLAGLLTFIVLVVGEEDWRSWHALNSFKTEWEAKGEKFDWASAIPPAVPDEQNFAMSPVWIAQMKSYYANEPAKARAWYGNRLDALDVARLEPYLPMEACRTNDNQPVVHLGDWRQTQPTDLKAWQEYYRNPPGNRSATEFAFPSQPQSPADDILFALSKYDPVITQLKKDSERPDARFPIRYDTEPPGNILLPHLAWLKYGGQVLALRALAELENGNTQNALNDEKLIWRFTDSMRTEPFIISHLVRIAEIRMALQPVWEGLANHRWSDAELVELERGLRKFNFLADFEFAARGERLMSLNSMEYMRRTGDWLTDTSDFSPPVTCLIPRAFYYQNELVIERMLQQWILTSVDVENRTVSPAQVMENDQAAYQELQHFSLSHVFARLFVPAIEASVKRFAEAQAAVDLARVAIALERYRLQHGEFPETLNALEPQFLETVPHDVIDGQPLHYRRTNDGQFILYSVGWNETDDDGTVILRKGSIPEVDMNQGDWVWKYPAR